MPDSRAARIHKGIIRHSLHQLLTVDVVRFGVARARYVWFAKVRGRIRTLEDRSDVSANAVAHNMRGLRQVVVDRMLYLLRPLAALSQLGPDSRILVVGPRTEGDILLLLALGFSRDQITAIDLISYSPWVQLTDMHAMPFEDRRFDAVILGWVLAYSENRPRAVSEIVRVLKPGGIVAIGVESNRESNEDLIREHGYLPGSADRIHNTQEILVLFGSHVGDVIFRQDVPAQEAGGPGESIVLFSTARKGHSSIGPADPTGTP